jgi:pyridoxal phosphate enzyme (YggS family)
MSTQDLTNNLATVRKKIADICKRHQRGRDEVCLIAVSKTRSVQEIRALAAQGQTHFGENYVQESLDKIAEITDIALIWHFIGPIQKNKTKLIAENFSWVHSIDRESVALRLNNQRPSTLPALNVCLQINIDDEDSKSGITPTELLPLAEIIQELPNLKLRGLMAIPAATQKFEQQSAAFHRMAALLDNLKQHNMDVDTLSMGMSNDYEAAIACGSTMVRIGTAIFGPRHYS